MWSVTKEMYPQSLAAAAWGPGYAVTLWHVGFMIFFDDNDLIILLVLLYISWFNIRLWSFMYISLVLAFESGWNIRVANHLQAPGRRFRSLVPRLAHRARHGLHRLEPRQCRRDRCWGTGNSSDSSASHWQFLTCNVPMCAFDPEGSLWFLTAPAFLPPESCTNQFQFFRTSPLVCIGFSSVPLTKPRPFVSIISIYFSALSLLVFLIPLFLIIETNICGWKSCLLSCRGFPRPLPGRNWGQPSHGWLQRRWSQNQPNWADIRGKLLVSTSGAMTRCSWGEKNWRYKWDFHQIPNRLGSPFDYGILWVSMV